LKQVGSIDVQRLGSKEDAGVVPTTTVFYSEAYTAAKEVFDTTRKAGWIVTTLHADPIPGVELVEPTPLEEQDLLKVHSPDYVAAVRCGEPRTLAESSGFPWDPQVWRAVCSSNGGAVAAAIEAFRTRRHTGSLSSGLHHASARSGSGFCTFNGLALAARAVLDAGATSVLILDLDAHCGGGTYSIVKTWPAVVQLDIAGDSFDAYTPDRTGSSTLDLIHQADAYLPTLERRLAEIESVPFDVMLYNAGVDAYQGCDIGGLRGVTSEVLGARERIVFDWATRRAIPLAFVLAGGYSGLRFPREELVRQHRATIAAAAVSNAREEVRWEACDGRT
jgi:acetoin utilization deacetylase AcuC-like enzyme